MPPKQELVKHTQAEDNIISLENFSSGPESPLLPLYSHFYVLSRMFMQCWDRLGLLFCFAGSLEVVEVSAFCVQSCTLSEEQTTPATRYVSRL